jgi:hypothetical protein
MKIAFFTEMGFGGKISRIHNNMRTEFAWMCVLEAEHYNITHAMESTNYIETPVFDLGVVIIPKTDPSFDIDKLRMLCKKVAVMQEGPNWLWQDYTLEQQIWYFNTLVSADIIFTHNESDRKYYQGLTTHPNVRVMPSLIIEDAVGELKDETRTGVIIGGNFVSWYGGFDSYVIAQELDDVVNAPSMGRKQPMEEHLIKHLPYMNWTQWIHALNKFKYGVHLMRTHAAGTFALNCSYLGIPCIGYRGLDTQEQLHPDLTVDIGDLESARKIAKKLRNDEEFYLYCSNITKQLYKEKYHENKFYTTFQEQFKIS